MRYFGTLDEKEWVGNLMGEYKFGTQNKLQAGFTCKDKSRDYFSTRFYYNLNKLNPTIGSIEDIYTPSGYLNQESINNGQSSYQPLTATQRQLCCRNQDLCRIYSGRYLSG